MNLYHGSQSSTRFPLQSFSYRSTIVFLIEEKSGLLSFFNVDHIFYAIFYYFHICCKILFFSRSTSGLRHSRNCYKAFEAFHSFVFTNFCITALIDSANLYPVFKKHTIKSARSIVGFNLSIPSASDSTTSTSENLSITIPGRKSASPDHPAA